MRFLGRRDDLEQVFAASDGLLLPTRYDAFANVCLEAAAAGCPVITSATNGAAEILEAGGWVVEDPEDAQAFAAAIDEPEEAALRRAGAAARAVAERYSWERHVAELRAVYEEIRRR